VTNNVAYNGKKFYITVCCFCVQYAHFCHRENGFNYDRN